MSSDQPESAADDSARDALSQIVASRIRDDLSLHTQHFIQPAYWAAANESDRGMVIVLHATVENAMRDCLAKYLVPGVDVKSSLKKQGQKARKIFIGIDTQKPTFSYMPSACFLYALGFLRREDARFLVLLNDMRILAAHSADDFSLDSDEMQRLVLKLPYADDPNRDWGKPPKEWYRSPLSYRSRLQLLSACASLGGLLSLLSASLGQFSEAALHEVFDSLAEDNYGPESTDEIPGPPAP